jgi:hypothetical protein
MIGTTIAATLGAAEAGGLGHVPVTTIPETTSHGFVFTSLAGVPAHPVPAYVFKLMPAESQE